MQNFFKFSSETGGIFAYDGENVYFYARTDETITKHTGNNWMLLFIDSDNNKSTGWEGYDYLINYSVVNTAKTVVCKYEKNVWKEIGITDYNYVGKEIQIRVSRAALGLTGENIKLGFHWMDNITNVYSLYDWFTTGDSAPERRNNYFVNVTGKFTGNKDAKLEQREETKIQYMLPAGCSPFPSLCFGTISTTPLRVYTRACQYICQC